jgi:conjugative transfer signal peptidase TraF
MQISSQGKIIAAGAAIACAFVLTLAAAGARVNTSGSIPVGLYWTSDALVEKGAYVLFCPPQLGVFSMARERGYIGAGFCPGNYGYMMKRILAAKNDTVAVTDDGVSVNGFLLRNSKPVKADKAGRPLPHYRASFTLKDSELLLMSDSIDIGFDARYFGPIDHSHIKSVIYPVFTWGEEGA